MNKFLGLICILAYLSCSPNTNQSGTQDFPNALALVSREALFDLPVSLLPLKKNSSLPRLDFNWEIGPGRKALEPYLWVTRYVNEIENAKAALEVLILELSQQKFLVNWSGKVDSLFIITEQKYLDEEQKQILFIATKDADTLLEMRYTEHQNERFKGFFILKENNILLRIDFNTLDQNNHQMDLWFENFSLDVDVSKIYLRASKNANAEIFISGASFISDLKDTSFWDAGPYIYSFQSYSSTRKSLSIYEVGFIDLAQWNGHNTNQFSLDSQIRKRLVDRFKQSFQENEFWKKLVFFSLDKNITFSDSRERPIEVAIHQSSIEIDDFNEVLLKKFFDLNRNDISDESNELFQWSDLFYLYQIRQPIVLGTGLFLEAMAEDSWDSMGISEDDFRNWSFPIIHRNNFLFD
jgi:hypothetical protein